MSLPLNVLSQYAEGASFLWQVRNQAVGAPDYSLEDLAKLDDRIDAHVDGLRIAEDDGWQLCQKELAWKEPGEVFAAAILAFEHGDEERIAQVLKVVTDDDGALVRGLISALGWLSYEQSEPHIMKFCASDSPALQRIGIAGAAIHRMDPGNSLDNAISSPDPTLRARGLRAVGEFGRLDLVPLIQHELNSEDYGCRFWSAWSIALLAGNGNAVDVLRSSAELPGPYRRKALDMGFRRMDTYSGLSWQQRLATTPQTDCLAVAAAGVMGDSALIPWLIEHMENVALARAAGEAFTMITGVDIAYQDLDGERPDGFEPGPNDDPEDENVELDADENLPWPDPALIANWWDKYNGEFQPNVRYLLGKPITVEWMHKVLRIGRQRQRTAAALELAISEPGRPLFEVRAPGFRQKQWLQSADWLLQGAGR